MSEQEQQTLPAQEFFSSSITSELAGGAEGYFFLVSEQLRTLYFYNGPIVVNLTREITEGVKSFQRSINEPSDGRLSLGQLIKLIERSAERHRSVDAAQIGINNGFFIFIGPDRASARGTWHSENVQLAFQFNSVEIRCEKSSRTCAVFEGFIDPNNSGGRRNLMTSTQIYSITRWNRSELFAEYNGDCRTVALHLNVSSNEVIQITRNNDNSSSENCRRFTGPLALPQIAKLVDGFQVSQNINKKERDDALARLSPSYRDLYLRIRSSMQ
jgi:hypothetical protein